MATSTVFSSITIQCAYSLNESNLGGSLALMVKYYNYSEFRVHFGPAFRL